MKNILIMLVIGMFLIVGISAADFDNVIEYSNNDLDVKFTNVFGLGSEIGEAKLTSHKSVTEIRNVFRGSNRAVMYYDFNWNNYYENGLGEVIFTDVNTGNRIDKQYYFARAIYEDIEIDDYKWNCFFGIEKGVEKTCYKEKIGNHIENKFIRWERLDDENIPKGDTRIALITDVGGGDYIDAIWTIAGKQVNKHASWTESMNTGLVHYWNLEDNIGTNATDSIGDVNLTLEGTISWVDGKVNYGLNIGDGTLNNTGNLNVSTDGDYSVSFWINDTSSSGDVGYFIGDVDSDDNRIMRQTSDGYGYFVGGTNFYTGAASAPYAGIWVHLVGIVNSSGHFLYKNGTLIGNSTGNTHENFKINNVKFKDPARSTPVTLFDEIGIWNRSLTESEISNLWNDGIGITYAQVDSRSIAITLDNPSNSSTSSELGINFNATLDPTNTNITNATLYIWFSNDSLFLENLTVVGLDNKTQVNWNVSNFISDTYTWNVYAYDNYTNISIASSNFTFEWIPFTLDSENAIGRVVETSRQTFVVNVTSADGYTVSNGRLVYNGTSYPNAAMTTIDDDSFSLSQTINLPAIDLSDFNATNVSYYWNISVTNEGTGSTSHVLTDKYNQTVDELEFVQCETDINITILNFTLYDEITGNLINASSNATSIEASFQFGAYSENKAKNYSITNLSSLNNTFLFCTDNSSRTIYSGMNSIFSAVDYTERNYYLTNATLTNDTSNTNIYLIPDDSALEFFITITQNLRPVEGAYIQLAKYFVGEGVYKTIEIDQTDSNGEFNAYLDLDRDYRVTIIEDGSVLGIKTFKASCDEAPCTITIDIEGVAGDILGFIDSLYAENVVYNLSYNPLTKVVTYEFVDTTGLAEYFRMAVYQTNTSKGAVLISNQSLYTSSGSLTFNATGYEGQFKVETYVSRSPELLNAILTFIIEEIFESLGENVGEYLLLGLMLIMTFIFGMAFKPSVLILSVPIIMTLGSISGLFPISGIVVTIFWVLAILGVIAIK